ERRPPDNFLCALAIGARSPSFAAGLGRGRPPDAVARRESVVRPGPAPESLGMSRRILPHRALVMGSGAASGNAQRLPVASSCRLGEVDNLPDVVTRVGQRTVQSLVNRILLP